jgi:hypothetical protein
MIRWQFVRGSGLSSAAIAWFSSGVFSHVDTVLPDGRLLGARSDTVGGITPGVRIRPANYEKWAHRMVMEIPCTAWQENAYYEFLHKQIGKPYDKRAIWGFVTGRNWRDDDSWICSEVTAASAEAGTLFPRLYLPVNKITPVALACLGSAIKGKIAYSS